jgi:PAS domain S-box-containing protein
VAPAENANRYPVEKLPWAIEKLAQSEYLSIPDVTEMSLDGVFEKEILKSANINCLIAVPVIRAGFLLGCLGFSSVKKRVKRRGEIVSLLKIVGEIFSNALERKRNEEEHLRLITAIEQAEESISIIDPDGTIIYVNPAFEHVAKYAPDKAIGKVFPLLMVPDNEELRRAIWEALNRGEVWSGRISTETNIGTRLYIECNISPVQDQSGNIVNHVVVMKITQLILIITHPPPQIPIDNKHLHFLRQRNPVTWLDQKTIYFINNFSI